MRKKIIISIIAIILIFSEVLIATSYSSATNDNELGTSVGSVRKGVCTITGNVKEYIDDKNLTSISNIKIELFDKDGNKIQLYDNSGKAIDAIYSDKDGNYQINGVENSGKEYIVQFTYGAEEQLRINPKYNGQDYQSKKGDNKIEVTSEKSEKKEISNPMELKQKEEEVIKEYYKEGTKIDVYFILDCSGSMDTVVEHSKIALRTIGNKIFELYGDDAQIGLIAYGHYDMKAESFYDPFYDNCIIKEVPLSNKEQYKSKIFEAMMRVSATRSKL